MSFIAAALAKSKGKDVQPPPQEGLLPPPGLEMPSPPHPQDFPSENPFQKRRSGKLRLLVVLAGVLLAVGILLFVKFRSHPAPPPVQAKPVPAKEAAKPAPPAAKPAAEPAKTAVTPPVAKPAEVAPAPVAPKPAEELLAIVHKFNVSAVMSGPNGRARIDGKTYYIGDPVIADLVLVDIRDGQLFFKDTVGAIYAKRF
jgi:hypothetical protein